MPSLITLSMMVGTLATSVVADVYNVNVPSGFFPGPQSGIGSWYRASTGQDSTNGNSWCGYKYYNSDPLFAPSLKAMGGATYNSNPDAWRQQTRKYCGLEAKVTDPTTGKSQLMYIGDSFDDQWVRTPASIDIMIDAFSNIHGNPNGDKNNVIKGVQWELTGRVNTKYAAPGASWPPASSGSGTGGLGAKCDGQTKLCNSGLTCLSPDGVCSDKACNWGCQGWSCSSSVPCQKPWNCVSGFCNVYKGKW